MRTEQNNKQSEIEVRGCLTKPKKSKYYHAVLTFFDVQGHKFDKQQISTRQTVKTEAMRVMLDMVDEKKETCLGLCPRTLFVDFMKHWVETIIKGEVEETTYCNYLLNVNNHIIPYFKPMKLRLVDLSPKIIQRFLDEKCDKGDLKTGKGLASNSVKKFHANLKTALDYAVREECIEYNPARVCRVKREKKPFVASYYTFEEVIRLCKGCVGTPIEHAIMLCSFYGLRRGEVLGLKWKNVDFSTNTIKICETVTVANGEIEKGTKNVSSNRVMPMILGFSDYLKTLKTRQQETVAFFGKAWTDEQHVVADESGERFKIGRLTKCFKRLIKAAALHDIRFHDLRHSNATFLLEYGIRIEEVSAWLGHSSSSTTEKIYAHVHIGIRKNTGQSLDHMMGFQNASHKKMELSIEDTLKMLFAALRNAQQKPCESGNLFEVAFEPSFANGARSEKKQMGKVLPFKSSNG